LSNRGLTRVKTKSFCFALLLLFGRLLCLTATGQPLTRVANTSLRMPTTQTSSSYSTEQIFGNVSLTYPVCFATPPGETNRLFIVEEGGKIIVITNLANPTRTVFLDISGRVTGGNPGSEAGLLSMAFHPDYRNNRYFFVSYCTSTTSSGGSGQHNRLSRFQTSSTNPNQASSGSELVLINQFDEGGQHNGEHLLFGPDGYLYYSVGDEGGQPEKYGNYQRIDGDFFSGIFRIDVDKKASNLNPNSHPAASSNYKVPADNPWVGATSFNGRSVTPGKVRTEFYAVGLRNPWRMFWDVPTGTLYCGDVGEFKFEELNVIRKGGNYGRAYREGTQAGIHANEAPSNFSSVTPIANYSHGSGQFQGNSVICGVVYRGTRLTGLTGAMIFSDHVSGNLWQLRYDGSRVTKWERIGYEPGIASFGVDPRNGDVLMAYVKDNKIKRLTSPTAGSTEPPSILSGTGAFSDLASLTPNPGIVPYELNVPFWSDNAIKRRWFSVPSLSQKMTFNPDGNWTFPDSAVWVKHFDLELTNGVPSSRKRIETRFLVKTAGSVLGFTYRWGSSTTDATLVAEGGMDETFTIREGATTRLQTWHYPSRTECLTCHTPVGGHALGFSTWQLNRDFNYSGGAANQLRALSDAGYFTSPVGDVTTLRKLASANDTSASLEHRFRSYVAANCVQCHQPGGAGGGTWDARITTPLVAANILNGVLREDGDPADRVIKPGDPAHSMLLTRISSAPPRRMPPLATSVFDTRDMDLVTEFILNLPDPRVVPIVKLPLNENGGATAVNLGSAGGSLSLTASTPAWTGNVPSGIGGASALDFGTATGNFVAESPAPIAELGGLSAFTITGWINNRSATEGAGGNRVVTWINNGGDGVDLVYHADGSLQLGIDQWPDTSPARSSADKITADPAAGPDNWRFFAVTYDAAAQEVRFYFGSAVSDATLDVARAYTGRGPVGAAIGRLALGHFNSVTRSSALDRMLRGLIDQVQIYGDALSASEIGLVQRTGSPVAPPSAPANLVATPDDLRVDLSWNASANALRYVVKRSLTSGSGYAPIATNLVGTSYTDTGVLNGTTYYYVVSAVNGVGEGPDSAQASATPQLFPPPAPTGLAAGAGNARVALTWVAAARATGYNVKRSTISGGPYSVVAANVSGTAFTDTNVLNDNTYYYVVSAVNTSGESPNSAQASATPQATPPPIVKLTFYEGSGTAIANSGSAGGTLTRSTPTPAFSANVPNGGGSSVDFGTSTGNVVVESPAAIAALGGLSSFTISGWLNARSLAEGPGGNRVLSWINGGGDGVDLVCHADGSLQLGIDEWPDSSPARSTAGKLIADAGADAGNWRFFAVTYDAASSQVAFYFGSASTDAALDVTRGYARGAVGASIGRLAVGHFNSVTRSGALDRMFRGLVDEIQVHGSVLSLAEIITLQRAPASPPTTPPPAPTGLAATAGNGQVLLAWSSAGTASSYNLKRSTTSGGPYGVIASGLTATTHTDTGLANGTTYYYVVSAVNAVSEGANSSQASATPQALPAPIVKLLFDETSGTTTANAGSAGGTLTLTTPTPLRSANVPNGGGARSVDFGTATGNYGVESAAPISALAGLSSFTLCGWVNCRSASEGPGGNRIVTWINNGGDGVDLVYRTDGSLQLGIDEWPDTSPARSSAGRITTDASAGLGNWRFFAIVYDSTTAQVKFFFGSNAADAALDVTRSYPGRGAVGTAIGRLGIGHFNLATRPIALDRMFRGLIDSVHIFGSALSPAEIVTVQRSGDSAPPPPPPPSLEPLIYLALDEASGATTANAGSLGGTLTLTTPTPSRSANIPAVGGARSVDFGTITGNFGIDTAAPLSGLAGLNAFTLCGWVNCRSATEGTGGNRIVSWINKGGDGVDLVYRSDGSLQIGIDQWPDFSPARSAGGKITTDAAAGAGNWRFFAVTYDGSVGQVQFYFGSPTVDAALDVTRAYGRGPVGTGIERLTVGHFNLATRPFSLDRMFRGLIDEVRVYGQVLTLAQIRAVQQGAAPAPTGDTGTGSGALGLRITSIQHDPDGTVRLQVLGLAGGVYRILASTDLIEWEEIGLQEANAAGWIEFHDGDAGELPTRFYRVVTP
jgi:uncharacterized repeat protein (TIGR03806 family)